MRWNTRRQHADVHRKESNRAAAWAFAPSPICSGHLRSDISKNRRSEGAPGETANRKSARTLLEADEVIA
jgi:hypothetical protein